MSRRGLLAIALLVVLLFGHWAFHYRARVRAGSPSADATPLRLLSDQRFQQRVWLAYPHQNLGRLLAFLEGRAQADPGRGDAVAGLLGLLGEDGLDDGASLPPFGPFVLPPASEMTVALGDDDSFAVSARVYPGVMAVARLAGWLARNPYLAGGEVTIDSQPARVAWQGRSWTLMVGSLLVDSSGESLPQAAPERARGSQKVLVQLELDRRFGPLSAGGYSMASPVRETQGEGGALVFRLRPVGPEVAGSAPGDRFESSTSKLARWPLEALDGSASLLAVDGLAGVEPGRSALLVIEQGVLGGTLQLPRSVALEDTRVETRRFELPGESLARHLGFDLREGERAGWRIHAMDRKSRDTGERIVPLIQELLIAGEPDAIATGLWFRPQPLYDMAHSLAETLDRVPLVSRRERQRWRDIEAAMAVLLDFEQVAIVAFERRGLELRWVPIKDT